MALQKYLNNIILIKKKRLYFYKMSAEVEFGMGMRGFASTIFYILHGVENWNETYKYK